MTKRDIPFETTPQILRYLEKILNFEENFFGQLTGDILLIDTYQSGEPRNLKTELNLKAFFTYLARLKAIEDLTDWLNKSGKDEWVLIKFADIEGQRATIGYPKKQRVRILNANKIKELYNDLIETKDGKNNYITSKDKLSDKYNITLKDREIWVNDRYLLSKPHSIGSNMEFFLYILDNQDKEIKRSELPQNIITEIKGKKFSKIINALGFKGEILKAFFPKRGKGSVLFKQSVNKSELKKIGINEDLFLKELALAHAKHGPK